MADIVHVGMGKETTKRWIRFALIGLAVIVVAGAAGAVTRWLVGKNSTPTTPTITAKPLQKNAGKAQNLALDGDFEAAHKEINDALASGQLSSDERYEVLRQQGITYDNQQKYQEALATYQEAAKIKETQIIYESMAVTAANMGNKEQAIQYYKKAIQFIADSNPVGEADKDSYEKKIRALGGQP
ncbi:MAG TPA: hypothetical protein VJ836_06700 [Candidatus Saccharimonadales bacterium]|nr:hypothetical protein [Candidatus Saccharimonadales bacterium]